MRIPKISLRSVKTLLKTNLLTIILVVGCLGLSFLAGTIWIEKSNQADAVARLQRQNELLSKQLTTSNAEFKTIKSSLLPPLRETDRADGSLTADIILVEYSDLECPFCKDFNATITTLEKEYGDKLTHVFRHLPVVSLHQNAPMEAEAAECVAEQAGNAGFFKFTNAVFTGSKSNGSSYTETDMQTLAGTLGFSSAALKTCMESNSTVAAIDASIKEAKTMGVTGTPTWFLIRTRDGLTKQAVGAKKIEAVREVLNEMLSKS
jgi:protein-disulfide isomerase